VQTPALRAARSPGRPVAPVSARPQARTSLPRSRASLEKSRPGLGHGLRKAAAPDRWPLYALAARPRSWQWRAAPGATDDRRVGLGGHRGSKGPVAPPRSTTRDQVRQRRRVRAWETRGLLRRYGVLALYSPPETPQYNGSCEAGIGSIETRAHYIAAQHDRPGAWTADDVEQARPQANETARPQGTEGPTPDELWQWREPITQAERRSFTATYWKFFERAQRTQYASRRGPYPLGACEHR